MSALDSAAQPALSTDDAESDAGVQHDEGRAGSSSRQLTGEKAQRIVEAMRASVARRGTAASTFDQVSREAGVSRGLLHYYFGTKEQLLVRRCATIAACAWSASSASSRKRAAHRISSA